MVRRGLVLVLLLAACACHRASTETAGPSAPAIASAATPAAPPPPPASVAPSASEKPSTAPTELPPIDASCRTDADCGYAYTYLIDGKCCSGTCSQKPASRAWLEATAKRCETLGWEQEHCPVKKCVEPAPLACVSGRCVASREL